MSTSGESRPRIMDVAREAGVSITTVSHVFSGKRAVNAETRRRVTEVATRLDYRPRVAAQALATGRTNTIALQLSVGGEELLQNASFFGALLPALTLAALERGYSFLYVPPREAARPFADVLVNQRRVDAALVVDPMYDDPFVEAVQVSRIPLVTIGRIVGKDADTWVDNDHGRIYETVVAHLNRAGYERPALLTIRSKKVSYIVDYTTTFAGDLGRAAVVTADALSERAAAEAALAALDGERSPDAFFCLHEQLAAGAALAIAARGLRVPDVGIVCLGDSVLTRRPALPLTAVRVYPERFAAGAIALLDDLLHGRVPEAPVVVPARLVVRSSTRR